MTPPLTTEAQFLGYLIKVATTLGDAALRFQVFGPTSDMAQSERDAIYALGRIREACAQRVHHAAGEFRAFLVRMIALASAESGNAGVPPWPASALASIVGQIRHRLALDLAA